MYNPMLIIVLAVMLYILTGCGKESENNTSTHISLRKKANLIQDIRCCRVQIAKNSFAAAKAGTDITNFIMDHTNHHTFLSQIRPKNKVQYTIEQTNTGVFINAFFDDLLTASIDSQRAEYNCSLSGQVTYLLEQNDGLDTQNHYLCFHECKTASNVIYDGKVNFRATKDESKIQYEHFTIQKSNEYAKFNFTISIKKISDTTAQIIVNGTKIEQALYRERVWTFDNWAMVLDSINQAVTIDGTLTLQSTPSGCADKRYIIETIEKINLDEHKNNPISGKIVINDLVYTFNSDNSVMVLIHDQPEIFSQNNLKLNCRVNRGMPLY